MKLGEPDDSGRRRPVPIAGSEYTVECSSVIAAIGQSVNLMLAEDEGLEVNRWGIVVDPKTMAANIPGVFAGGDAVLGADLAVRAVAAGRIASVSIDQFLNRKPVTGPSDMVSIAMRAVSDLEKAAFFRAVEKSPRPRNPVLDLEIRRTSFTEVNPGLSEAVVASEASRCMTCGCRKADDCQMRMLATEYQADPYRFSGERRRFSQDTTHPEIIYEPGKCILCDACVRIAAEAGEELGVAAIGRGFRVAMGVPFDQPLSEGLRRAALKAAENCPTGALAVRTSRSCDLGTCAKTSFAEPSSLESQKS
jgi:formate dehydrogenase major subunit